MQFSSRIVLAVCLSCALLCAALPVRAQDDFGKGGNKSAGGNKSGGGSKSGGNKSGGGGGKPGPKNAGPSRIVVREKVVYRDRPAGPPTVKVVERIREVPKIVRVTPNTGTLTVTAEAGAEIMLDGPSDELEGTIADDARSMIFDDLKPGVYTVTAKLEGYAVAPQTVTVKAGKADKVDLTLKLITYTVPLNLNTNSGLIAYRQGQDETWSMTPFQTNQIRLAELPPGVYEVQMTPNDKSFEMVKQTWRIPEDLPKDGAAIPVSFKKRPTAQPFAWQVASDWTLPAGWSADKTVLANGPGVALPRDSSFRYYTDFQVCTDAKMLNGVGVSFVLRAADEKNYYLVQVTGAKADEPYKLRGYIVKNGQPQRFGRTENLKGYATTLQENKFFRILLKMKDAQIEVSLRDSETGEISPLGVLNDPEATFSVGAVGLAATSREESRVAFFYVSPKPAPCLE